MYIILTNINMNIILIIFTTTLFLWGILEYHVYILKHIYLYFLHNPYIVLIFVVANIVSLMEDQNMDLQLTLSLGSIPKRSETINKAPDVTKVVGVDAGSITGAKSGGSNSEQVQRERGKPPKYGVSRSPFSPVTPPLGLATGHTSESGEKGGNGRSGGSLVSTGIILIFSFIGFFSLCKFFMKFLFYIFYIVFVSIEKAYF